MNDEVKIYVYGSCHFSDHINSDQAIGNGGYGVVISSTGKKIDEISGGFSHTTNARMDIHGITQGLKRINKSSIITVYLSNGYVIDTLTKGWLEKWKANGFKKKKNADLWQELDRLINDTTHTIKFKHSQEVKFSPDYQLAEQLGKAMSGKKNLSRDLSGHADEPGLFGNSADQNEDLPMEDDKPILDSICVDASSILNPGPTEYRGVDTKTKKLIFEKKFEEGTNNIGEFLAIVHALALYKNEGKALKILYSDSLNAISWVKQKRCKTKLEKSPTNAKVFDAIERAEIWLASNSYETKILKWNTGAWGQIPADYGRK